MRLIGRKRSTVRLSLVKEHCDNGGNAAPFFQKEKSSGRKEGVVKMEEDEEHLTELPLVV